MKLGGNLAIHNILWYTYHLRTTYGGLCTGNCALCVVCMVQPHRDLRQVVAQANDIFEKTSLQAH